MNEARYQRFSLVEEAKGGLLLQQQATDPSLHEDASWKLFEDTRIGGPSPK